MTWLLPSDDPAKLKRFFMACRDMALTTPGIVLVNKDLFKAKEEEFKQVLAPQHWKFFPTLSEGFVEKVQEAWTLYSNAPWVGIVGDDCVPLSINWDTILVNSITGTNIVCPLDDAASITAIGHGTVWSGDILRALGYLFSADLPTEADNYASWAMLADQTASLLKKTEVVVRRIDGEDIYTPTNAFRVWQETKEKDLIDQVEQFKISKGVIRFELDFSGTSVMIAVPTVTGGLDYEFLICAHETFNFYGSVGVPYQFIIEPFNADLVMARSKLFGKFMHSDCTHMLMLDSDMGWDLAAIQRLHAAKKDFVAVAGPKKKSPLACAVTPIALNDHQGQVIFERDSGTVEVAEVGAAFCLITKDFGHKMIAAYPELAFQGMGGVIEHALFMPTVDREKKVYKAEDYSFCRRWRDIGGKVYVCPDISLKHIGRKTYEGAWSTTWNQQDQALKVVE